MRILVLNYEYPPLGGGAGNATYFLAREWGKMGISTDIITTWFTGLEEIKREMDNVTVYRIKSFRKKMEQSNPLEMLSYTNLAYKKAVKLVTAQKYTLIVAFFSIPCGLVARKIFKRFKTPYIVLLRGGDVPGFLPQELGFMHRITMPVTKTIWKNAQRIIANSKWLSDLANKTAVDIDRTVEMVPNGVDTSFFVPVKHTDKKPFIFLFVGRFVNQKNLIFLLSQFEIANRNNYAKLILTGDGPERGKLVEKINSSTVLKKTVELKPWEDKKNLLSIYQTAHCFVNLSVEEGMSNATLEAMSCGLPVIASNIGGNIGLVIDQKNGYLVNLDENLDLNYYILQMINNVNYESMASYSRYLAQTHFSWKSSASLMVKDYLHAV
jgi:glycosyltransferase involved in cell wall biosynthesis